MMSVHQLKDGRWFVHYPRGHNASAPERTREYFGRGAEAEALAIARNIELGLGVSKSHTGPTFSDLAREYITNHGQSVASTTLYDLGLKLDGYILPMLGDLRTVTRDDLDRYVSARLAKGIKRTSIHRELCIIRAIIKLGADRKLIAANWMEGYKFPKRDDAVIPPPTSAELDAIYQAAPPHLKRFIMLMYFTAQRPGGSEALALRWDHVDMINQTVFVESAKKGGMVARSVPMCDELATLMRKWFDEDKAAGHLEYVVHYKGKRMGSIKRSWAESKKRAGITRRIRPYDLRHMSASNMLASGADLKTVSQILGHSSPAITMEIYQHVVTSQRIAAVSMLGKCLPNGKNKTSVKTTK